MTDAGVQSAMQFEAPGPGPWARDAVHFPRPVTRYWAETHPAAFVRGTNDFARFYGLLIDGLRAEYVNGFAFNQQTPVPDAEVPRALPARGRGLRRQALA